MDESLARRVAQGLGIELPEKSKSLREPVDLPASPALSIQRNAKQTIEGRSIGILINEGSDKDKIEHLKNMIREHNGVPALIAPRAHGIKLSDGSKVDVDGILAGMPSVVFDAVAVVLSKEGTDKLVKELTAVQWVQDAYAHLKAITYTKESQGLLEKAGVDMNVRGISTDLGAEFIKNAGTRFWERELL